jgi:hypothetical protein
LISLTVSATSPEGASNSSCLLAIARILFLEARKQSPIMAILEDSMQEYGRGHSTMWR